MARVGLVLSGGGARAAYQIGVLQALRELGLAERGAPFAIYSGTSAGAINAAFLASGNDRWGATLDDLSGWWNRLTVEDICQADAASLLRSARRWAGALSSGWIRKSGAAEPPESFLDNTPLRQRLPHTFPLERVQAMIDAGHLDALAVSAFSYATAKHTIFYRAAGDPPPWTRRTRDARAEPITYEHLMASCALPLIFPTVCIKGERFGDGGLRQANPVSPAIHLGAERVFVIQTSTEPNGSGEGSLMKEPGAQPSPGQILGHAMANILSDQLASDVERVEMVNRVIDQAQLTLEQQKNVGLRRVELYSIRPSVKLDILATEHWNDLPRPLRRALAVMGADAKRPAVGSYLLFEPGYIRRLIALGHDDALRQSAEIVAFFGQAPNNLLELENKAPQTLVLGHNHEAATGASSRSVVFDTQPAPSLGHSLAERLLETRTPETRIFAKPQPAILSATKPPSILGPEAHTKTISRDATAMSDNARSEFDTKTPSELSETNAPAAAAPHDAQSESPLIQPVDFPIRSHDRVAAFFTEGSAGYFPPLGGVDDLANDEHPNDQVLTIKPLSPDDAPFNVQAAYFPAEFLAELHARQLAQDAAKAATKKAADEQDQNAGLPAADASPVGVQSVSTYADTTNAPGRKLTPEELAELSDKPARRFGLRRRSPRSKCASFLDPLADLGAEFAPFFSWEHAEHAVMEAVEKVKKPLRQRLFGRAKS